MRPTNDSFSLILTNREATLLSLQKKAKPESLVKPNKLRKQLLARIKDHQKRAEEKTPSINTTEQFSNDFNNSVQYLENLLKEMTFFLLLIFEIQRIQRTEVNKSSKSESKRSSRRQFSS